LDRVNRRRAARKASHHLNRSDTISRTVEYLDAALALARSHRLGMAIAEFDLTDWPASGVQLAENDGRAIPGAHRGALKGHLSTMQKSSNYN
jgi:hypothetical protein